MSLKLAALSSLTFLGTTTHDAGQARHLRRDAPYEPILITFGRGEPAAKPEQPKAAEREKLESAGAPSETRRWRL